MIIFCMTKMKKRMKTIKLYFIFIVIATGLVSCEKSELMTYEGVDNVYFAPSMYLSATRRDSTNVSFAYFKGNISDTLISVPVSCMGKISDKDREFKVEVNPVSTAKAGEHFDLISGTVILANSSIGMVQVRVKRSPDLLQKKVLLVLTLSPNENFQTNMPSVLTDIKNDVSISAINYRIFITDMLEKPARWLDTYLGAFSRKKCLLVCELLEITPSWLNGDPDESGATISIAQQIFYGTYTQRYLSDQAAQGNVILEDDGSPMVMGPSVQ